MKKKWNLVVESNDSPYFPMQTKRLFSVMKCYFFWVYQAYNHWCQDKATAGSVQVMDYLVIYYI